MHASGILRLVPGLTLSSTPLSPAVMIQAGAGGWLPVPFPMMYLLLMDPHRLRDRHRCSSGTQRAVKSSQAVLVKAGKTPPLLPRSASSPPACPTLLEPQRLQAGVGKPNAAKAVWRSFTFPLSKCEIRVHSHKTVKQLGMQCRGLVQLSTSFLLLQ